MRTTSTLEAYNGVLADNVVNKGHFFKFAHDNRSEEYFKSREATQLIESGGKTAKKRKPEWVVSTFLHILCAISMFNSNLLFPFIHRSAINKLVRYAYA